MPNEKVFDPGQGRTDGAICEYTEKDKMDFLQKCHDLGIRNIEMEASMFASVTKKVGVKAGDVCVTVVNRLEGDQVMEIPKIYIPSYIYNFSSGYRHHGPEARIRATTLPGGWPLY